MACEARPASHRDLILRIVSPGVTPIASRIGDGWAWNAALNACQTTTDWQMAAAPTGQGTCTQVAPADANPGYNLDTALPLEGVTAQAGDGC